jgi:ADP-ribose pyrophosphatase
VAAGALIVRDGKVLLVKRARPPNQGKWAIPGGLVELGESTREAAVREAKEELGLAIEIVGLAGVADDVALDPKGRVRYQFVLVDYLARPLRGEVQLNGESSDYGWFDAEGLRRIDVLPRSKELALGALAGALTR